MSASRKKQERKAAEEPMISSRALEEQKKEAERKRNTVIYTIVGIVVVILAAALLIWNSGVFQRGATAAEVGGEKISAGEVAYYYYNNQVMSTAQMYASYNIPFPYTLDKSPKDQVITADAISQTGIDASYLNKTYHEYFSDYALNSLREQKALLDAAKEAGYTLSAEGKQSIDDTLAELDANRESYLTSYGADLSRTKYLQLIYGKTMTEKTYKQCVENSTLASEFMDAEFNSIADYSAAELDSYYQENKNSLDSITYYWRAFESAEAEEGDEDFDADAALAEAKAAADAALAEVEADPDLVKDNEDYTEATGSLYPGSFYYDFLMDDARVSGDATVLDGGTGAYYLVVFMDRFLDETPTVNVRHILVEAANEDDPATEDVDESDEDPTEETWAAAKEKAQALLDQWKAGEATEESFAALVADNSADVGSNTNGGLYENVTKGSMIANFDEWIFAEGRQSGDVSEPVQNTQSSTQGWHLIYFVGEDEPAWITNARQAMWAADVEESITVTATNKLDYVLQ